jgi:hypothetical protein
MRLRWTILEYEMRSHTDTTSHERLLLFRRDKSPATHTKAHSSIWEMNCDVGVRKHLIEKWGFIPGMRQLFSSN